MSEKNLPAKQQQGLMAAIRASDMFCSFNPDSVEEKVALVNALTNPQQRIGDCINKQICVRDVIVKQVELAGGTELEASEIPADGPEWAVEREVRTGYRVILMDTNGVTYVATSSGIFNSITTIHAIFGTLHFPDGLTMEVKQVSTKRGKTLTLNLIG